MEQQNRFWGFGFGEREVRITEYIAIVVGVGGIVCGSLLLSGIWEIKP